MIISSWLHSVLILAVMLSSLAIASATVGEDLTSHFLLERKGGVKSGSEHSAAMGEGDVTTMGMAVPNKIPTTIDYIEVVMMEMNSNDPQTSEPQTKTSIKYHGLRGYSSAQRRRTADVEDLMMDMSTKDPSQWSAAEW
eukprot:CAMPEP_0196142230 /NCGR_PEP_ID=MMETSP0910-20130528/11353_1 /TAXON_ID=49265 /ORGANISM="Thalassiosira rotula, Strain GSO102" /LENGTH=138 /DNA_ID=CAMNT_0041403515 /DNA_START=42 /DNA_END=455 /DNA_ORIENTATION=+